MSSMGKKLTDDFPGCGPWHTICIKPDQPDRFGRSNHDVFHSMSRFSSLSDVEKGLSFLNSKGPSCEHCGSILFQFELPWSCFQVTAILVLMLCLLLQGWQQKLYPYHGIFIAHQAYASYDQHCLHRTVQTCLQWILIPLILAAHFKNRKTSA